MLLLKLVKRGRILAATLVLVRASLTFFAGLWWVYIPLLKLAAAVAVLAGAWMYFKDEVSPLRDHAATLGDIAGIVFDLGGVRGYATELEKLNEAASKVDSNAEAIKAHQEFRANRPTMSNIYGVASEKDIKESYRKLDRNRLVLSKLEGSSLFEGFGKKLKKILTESVLFFISDAQTDDIHFRDSFYEAFNLSIKQTASDGTSYFEQFGKSIKKVALDGSASFSTLGNSIVDNVGTGLGNALSFVISDAHGAVDELGKVVSKNSQEGQLSQFATLHPDLQSVLALASTMTNFTVIEAHRGEELQNKYFDEGTSQLQFPHSKHNQEISLAVDILPLPNKYNSTDEEWDMLAMVVGDAAATLKGVNITWGGNWENLVDKAHFELPGTTKAAEHDSASFEDMGKSIQKLVGDSTLPKGSLGWALTSFSKDLIAETAGSVNKAEDEARHQRLVQYTEFKKHIAYGSRFPERRQFTNPNEVTLPPSLALDFSMEEFYNDFKETFGNLSSSIGAGITAIAAGIKFPEQTPRELVRQERPELVGPPAPLFNFGIKSSTHPIYGRGPNPDPELFFEMTLPLFKEALHKLPTALVDPGVAEFFADKGTRWWTSNRGKDPTRCNKRICNGYYFHRTTYKCFRRNSTFRQGAEVTPDYLFLILRRCFLL